MYHFKAKDSEIKPYTSCVGNIFRHNGYSVDKMKKTIKWVC